jgi:hypothetical protein
MTVPLIVPPCIYHLTLNGGMAIFADGVDLQGIGPEDDITIDMTHAAILGVAPYPDGRMDMTAQKASESAFCFCAGKLTIKRKEIIGVQNTTNPQFIANCRQAISKLDIVADLPLGPHR